MSFLPTMVEVLKQILKKPATNLFPAKYLPKSITGFLGKVAEGKAEINPPVPTPENFRGKITYDRDICIGCKICTRVCPANAIEFIKETKTVRIYVTQCIFCSQCNDACPVHCLHMSEDFLLADEDRYSGNLIVE
ncbi:4Fe-4S ferredoxin iron-sulfur binding domain protein [Methanolacinia petrolearia DSM 11571]|uniref:4Fe-4S ferredoxin iron-sulfur binding domain protein n=1 Tax=Methanolacinia petrolearia (strain DSM 11571 / OCM 486 / SEBR 4847) TaxID=679926 RepID=E1RGN3_METP4|nr:4Fe-4S dicluster domain-containing protein [Methanolacinia petrolearia]ADN36328.1 4Fe-4S ferredoxin iron-sulfur binding domain protein [Methanolacinia petrolearia DSM 11571]